MTYQHDWLKVSRVIPVVGLNLAITELLATLLALQLLTSQINAPGFCLVA